MRYFFDYTSSGQSLYDYQGEEFRSAEDAYDFADATARLLRHTLDGDWSGWSVEVRDPKGCKCFSLAVGRVGAIAE